MKKKEFKSLQKAHGNTVVWKDKDGYMFSIASKLDDHVDVNDLMLQRCDAVSGAEAICAMGDDIMSFVRVTKLSDVDKVEGLAEFLHSYVGANCYVDE